MIIKNISYPNWEKKIALEISKNMHILKRIGKPSDISNIIQFLINPDNNWITGQTFTVDGGLSSTKETS